MARSSCRAWRGVIGRVLPKPAALMREALSETLPVRIATGEIRAYLPVSSDEGMAAGSGTSLTGLLHRHWTLRRLMPFRGCDSYGPRAPTCVVLFSPCQTDVRSVLTPRLHHSHHQLVSGVSCLTDWFAKKMNSIGEECNNLKKTYDACFNAWFKDEFLKGNTRNDKCAPLFKDYQKCVKVGGNKDNKIPRFLESQCRCSLTIKRRILPKTHQENRYANTKRFTHNTRVNRHHSRLLTLDREINSLSPIKCLQS